LTVGSRSAGRPGQHPDLDIDAGWQAQALVEGFNRFAGRLQNIHQALMGADFKLLAGFPIDVGTARDRVALDARRQRDGSMDDGARPLRRAYNLVRGPVQDLMIVGFHPNANALIRKTRQRNLLARTLGAAEISKTVM